MVEPIEKQEESKKEMKTEKTPSAPPKKQTTSSEISSTPSVKSVASSGKKRKGKNIAAGIGYIQATFNNTIITIADQQGNTIAWSSSGSMGFKGARKATPYAAQTVAEEVARKAQEHGLKTIAVYVKGPGSGRESAIRALVSSGLIVTLIEDTTPIAHNGCRPPKRRRV